jgi:ubiquinone/menaquinone biosynthesis C-methylase UbiE
MREEEVMNNRYVHGYSSRESGRLTDQASTLRELLHHDSYFSKGEIILEAGCGTGAQTVILAEQSPDAYFISVDISPESVAQAEDKTRSAGFQNVSFINADISALPFEKNSFDHIFVCFVLEHLADPVQSLLKLKRLLKPKGTLTAIEGDHGSAYFHPQCKESITLIETLTQLQSSEGGNALIGRELYPLLSNAGFSDIRISPRMVYADGSRPHIQRGFTLDTFTAMVEGIKEKALSGKFVDNDTWDRGIRGLQRSGMPDGVFCYTFFKGAGVKK